MSVSRHVSEQSYVSEQTCLAVASKLITVDQSRYVSRLYSAFGKSLCTYKRCLMSKTVDTDNQIYVP
jgi:hypothetical protein